VTPWGCAHQKALLKLYKINNPFSSTENCRGRKEQDREPID